MWAGLQQLGQCRQSIGIMLTQAGCYQYLLLVGRLLKVCDQNVTQRACSLDSIHLSGSLRHLQHQGCQLSYAVADHWYGKLTAEG